MTAVPFAVAMGSNLGSREANLLAGAAFIMGSGLVFEPSLSGMVESDPKGGVEGGAFLNCVMVGGANGSPRLMLELCRSAESALGSRINKEGRARRLDVDLLFVGDDPVTEDDLSLPHPRMYERRFVLQPLSQVWEGPVPVLGASPADLLEKLGSGEDLRVLLDRPDPGRLWRL
ncbi:2-amino-4-hydroxy-6-hydroxymethyldihydropteridine diphosphokinase [Candidatus Fermentibacteria bacterium]|nr:2-amino-4-hydroxy-6-hydroxymethyldihydropteridine diphosphokinase [Candidatus Fermentibacteria bacterium]